jgi:hypothetical protein
VLDSFIEMLVRAPVDPDNRLETADEVAAPSGPGAPQTLQ